MASSRLVAVCRSSFVDTSCLVKSDIGMHVCEVSSELMLPSGAGGGAGRTRYGSPSSATTQLILCVIDAVL